MGKSARGVFVFSYHEHDWHTGEDDEGEGAEAVAQRFLQTAQMENWTPMKDPGDIDDYIEEYLNPDVTTVEELRALCEEMMSDGGYPEGILDAPFKKLADKMKAEGWKFVGGDFCEMEGNHNDTEITVALEMTKQKSPAKKAATKKTATKKPAAKKTATQKPPAKKTPAARKKK